MTADERRAARMGDLCRRYAIKFALDWGMDCYAPCDGEPTDENLSRVLSNCARRPRPTEYPLIRRYVLENRPGSQVASHDG